MDSQYARILRELNSNAEIALQSEQVVCPAQPTNAKFFNDLGRFSRQFFEAFFATPRNPSARFAKELSHLLIMV